MAAKRITPLSKAVDKKLYILGMTRMDLATKLGISYSYLSLVLRGDYAPPIDFSENMAKHVEMNARDIRELILKKAM